MRGKNRGKTKSASPSSASLPVAGLILFPTLCFGECSHQTPQILGFTSADPCVPRARTEQPWPCSCQLRARGAAAASQFLCGVGAHPAPRCPHPEGALTLRVPGLAPISQRGKEGRSCAFNCPCKVSAAWAALVLKRECLGARSRAQ